MSSAGTLARRLSPDPTAARLALFYGATLAVIGVYLPFFPVWLEGARGLSPEAIGWVLAAGFWSRVIASLLLSAAADRLGERRRPMIGLAAITLSGVALLWLAHGFWPLLLLSAVIGVSFAAIMPLGEALALQKGKERGIAYGRVRLWGSITFIVMAIGTGRWLEVADAGVILVALAATVAAMLLACLALPETRTPRASGSLRLRALLDQPGFVAFVLAAGLIQASHAVYYGFATLHWRAAGLGESMIGWLWAEGVVAEIVLFALAGHLPAWVRPPVLLVAAGGLAVVRWTGTALSTDPAALVALQVLHAASFGAAHLAAMYYLRDAVALSLQASAQGAHSALSALLFGLLTPLSGWLYGSFGGGAFLAMAAVALIGTTIAAWLARARCASS